MLAKCADSMSLGKEYGREEAGHAMGLMARWVAFGVFALWCLGGS
jgi:hypothetical protein